MEWRDSTGNDSEYNHAWLNHYEPQVPHTLTIPDLTLPQLLEHTARAYPANVATIFFGEKLTYAQLNDHIDRLAAGLRSLGVKPNERVGVVLPNCPQFIIGLYAALKAGAIAVPLNPNSTARELHNHFIDAGVSTIIAADTPLDRIQKAMVNSPAKQLIVTGSQEYFPPLMKLSVGRQNRQVGVASSIQGDNTYSFANLIRDNEPAQPHPEITQEDAALLVYTGGTTASPRGVKLSHRNLVANALQMNAWIWDAREERKEVVLGVVPLFHGYGVTVVMNLAISVGAAILLLPRFNMRETLRAITRFRPTIFPATPSIFNAVVNHPLVQRHDLRSIRVSISSGGPVPELVAQAYESMTGARLVEGYGLTEASSITHCSPIYGERRKGSIGLPLPLTEARVVDLDSRQTLPPGEIGELSVRGPQVMQGYSHIENDACGDSRDGWLYTGDMARRDDEGYFYIIDRESNIIHIDGRSVYPREVEDVLYKCDKVEEVVVAGVPGRQGVEVIKAYVVLKDDMEVTEQELRTFCSERLESYKVPARIEFREGLPRNSMGKYLRRALVQEELERQAR